MIIRGKERGFELNVQSHAEIEKLCENEDFSNFMKIFDGKTQGENIQMDMQIACILNKGYEDRKAYEDPSYSPVYLQMEDMRFMKIVDVQRFFPATRPLLKVSLLRQEKKQRKTTSPNQIKSRLDDLLRAET